MLRTPAGVDIPASSGGDYTADLLFNTPSDAKFLRVGDSVEDRVGVIFTILYWSTFPSDFTSGGEVILSGSTTPTQSLTTDDSFVFTPGQLNVRPRVQTDGAIITSTPGSGQLYEYEITATWTSSSEGNAATTGDHVIDATGKSYEITRINVPGSTQWASGIFVTELEKEGASPDTGLAYLSSSTPNFDFYQGKILNSIAEDTRRNRDEFTTDVVISGINTSVTNVAADLINIAADLYQIVGSGEEFVLHTDLAASGFVTQDELAASGFLTEASGGSGPHELLSSTHTDTIAQAAVSGGIVAAIDGAWSQLSPGIEGSILSVENGLPNYTDNITVASDGTINIGGDIVSSGDFTSAGNTIVSGDLTVLGLFNGTPDLTASGFLTEATLDLGPSGFLTIETLDLSASGFVTENDLAASGFVGTHELLSSEHTDTIAQSAVSGAIVAALDGAWSQLTPGLEGNIIFVENGLPAYNSNFTVASNGDISIGGATTVSGDLTVLGNLIGTPDLTASGFVVGPDTATDSTLALFDGTTGELIKELPTGANGLVLTVVSGEPQWAASSGGGGGGDISGPGVSTDNAIVRWDGTTGTVIQNSNIIISDSGVINFPAGTTHSVTQASGVSTFNIQNIDWLVRVDTQGQAMTVNLPPAPTDGQIHTIKDGNGNANNNNITITASAGQIIDPDSTTLTINLAYQAVELMWVSDPGIWHII